MSALDTNPSPGAVGIPLPAAAARFGERHPVMMFLVRRVLAGILTLLVLSFLIFLATNALPGNVAQAVLGKNATPHQLALLETRLHLNQPLLERYGSWLVGALHGNLGQSAVQLAEGAGSAPVSGFIGAPLVNSFVIALIATILLLPLTLLLGTLAAIREGRATDYVVSYTALLVGSLPEFVLGTFLILIFFSKFGWLPPVALVPPGTSPLDHIDALVLPVLTLVGTAVAFASRQVRAGVTQSLRQDYVMMARLNGLPERRVLWRYALRNALAPSVQAFAQTIQYLFGGIIVVEVLFDYPGVGSLLVSSVLSRDLTVVQAIALILAAVYILINILADLIVVFLVPKLRTQLA